MVKTSSKHPAGVQTRGPRFGSRGLDTLAQSRKSMAGANPSRKRLRAAGAAGSPGTMTPGRRLAAREPGAVRADERPVLVLLRVLAQAPHVAVVVLREEGEL